MTCLNPPGPAAWNGRPPAVLPKPLLAAHGLSCLITLNHQGRLTRILMDTANDPLPLLNNLEALGHQPEEIDAVVLSHGHPDHYGGLLGFLARRSGPPPPVYLHRDIFHSKLFLTPRGRVGPWRLEMEKLQAAGVQVHQNQGPELILDQTPAYRHRGSHHPI